MLCIKKEILWNSNAHLVWKGHKDKGQAANSVLNHAYT